MSDADKKASLDLGAMMDETLDNIEEAVGFTNPPAGEYVINVKDCMVEKYTPKPKDGVQEGEKQRFKLLYEVGSTISLADTKEQPVPDGSLFSETFMGTEEGLGYFKKRVREIMNVGTVDGVKLREIMDAVKGTSFTARIKMRITPKDKSNPALGTYENVDITVVAPKASA